jgi:hypothetical protein
MQASAEVVKSAIEEAVDATHGVDTGLAIEFLAFFLCFVRPQWVEHVGEADMGAYTERLLGDEADHPRWCTLVALAEALIGDRGAPVEQGGWAPMVCMTSWWAVCIPKDIPELAWLPLCPQPQRTRGTPTAGLAL